MYIVVSMLVSQKGIRLSSNSYKSKYNLNYCSRFQLFYAYLFCFII